MEVETLQNVLRLLNGWLVVVHRKGMAGGEELLERVSFVNETEGGGVQVMDVAMLRNVSSSQARKLEAKEELQEMLPPKVVDYIASHRLQSFEIFELDA